MKTSTMTKTLLAVTTAALSLTAVAGTPDATANTARSAGAGGFLQHHDADGDGMITLAEYQAAGDALFARLDLDGDGRLSADELKAAREAFGRAARERRHDAAERPRREGKAQRDGRHGSTEASPRRSERSGAHGLARMDADGDGYISRAEFDDARLERFSALDANGNGVIDADELPQRHGHGGQRGYGKRDFSRSK